MNSEDAEFQALCMAIGSVAITWAVIEQALDGMVAISFLACGGRDFQDDIPRSLTRKIDFLKRSLRKLEKLAPFREDGLSLMSDIAEKSADRHNLVHAVAMNLAPRGGSYRLVKFDYEKTRHNVRDIDFTLADFPRISREGWDLASRALVLATRIGKHLELLEGPDERPRARKPR